MTDKKKLEKIKKLADDIYYAAANLGPNVGSGERLRKTMKEYHQFIINEYHKGEPVSKSLEDDNSFEELLQEIYVKYNKEIPIEKLLDIASNFAKWQRKQDKMVEKLMAKNYATGFEAHKQQMMANTVDAMIGLPYENKDGGYTHIVDVSRPLPVGNNIIAIIFKED